MYNVDGFFDPLLSFLDSVVDAQLLSVAHRAMIVCETDGNRLLESFRSYEPPAGGKLAPPEA